MARGYALRNSIVGLIFLGVLGLGQTASAQSYSIPAAVGLVGGGIAAGIGNGIKASKGIPPDDLWDDAGWFIGGVNVLAGGGFLIAHAVSEEEVWGAVPIGVTLLSIGVFTLSMTAWAVFGAKDDPSRWLEDEDDWMSDEGWSITPTISPDDSGQVRYGVAFNVWGF